MSAVGHEGASARQAHDLVELDGCTSDRPAAAARYWLVLGHQGGDGLRGERVVGTDGRRRARRRGSTRAATSRRRSARPAPVARPRRSMSASRASRVVVFGLWSTALDQAVAGDGEGAGHGPRSTRRASIVTSTPWRARSSSSAHPGLHRLQPRKSAAPVHGRARCRVARRARSGPCRASRMPWRRCCGHPSGRGDDLRRGGGRSGLPGRGPRRGHPAVSGREAPCRGGASWPPTGAWSRATSPSTPSGCGPRV